MASWVELRVHGVSGTPPEDMLAAPVVTQVGGDGLGRFFRPASGAGDPLPPEETGGHVLEAYHWGLFTSGSFTKGLWFLLLPFGMVNAASFMLPATTLRWATETARAVLRLLGLMLTAVLALSVVQVFVDALAWRGPGHGNPRWVYLAVAGCVVVLGLVAFLGRGKVPPPPPDQAGALAAPTDDAITMRTALADEAFYQREPDAPLLRRLHGAAGLLIIALPFAVIHGESHAAVLRWSTVALLIVTGVAVASLADARARVRRAGKPLESQGIPLAGGFWEFLTWGLLGLAVVAVVLDLALGQRRPTRAGEVLPGLDDIASGLVLSGMAALFLLLVLVAVGAGEQRARRTDGNRPDGTPAPFRPYVGGMTGWVVAAIGTFVGLGFTVGLGYTVSWLASSRGARVPVPAIERSVALVWGVTGVVLLVLIVVAIVFQRSAGSRRKRTTAAYRRRFPAFVDQEAWVIEDATAATWSGGLKRHVGWAAAVFAGVGFLSGVFLVVGLPWFGLSGRLPGGADWVALRLAPAVGSARPDATVVRALVLIGIVLLVALAVGLLLAGRGALLHTSIRRGVNVIWDVMSFWPRAAHPIVPPPYSQRAVRDVADRITWLLRSGAADHVLLAGHSQGSLIAAAAVLRVPGKLHERLGLLTHGSQLQFAYPRAFPAYVNAPTLRWILGVLGGERWINLFRETDPFGGPVLSWARTSDVDASWRSTRLTAEGVDTGEDDDEDPGGVRKCGRDWRLLDPPVVDARHETWPGTRKHGDYYRDAAWPEVARTFWPEPAPEPAPEPEPPVPEPPPSIPSQQGDGKAPQQLGRPDALGGGHDAGAGEEVPPGPGR